MRNVAEIIKDDRNGKQLSQTERQIAVAYIQGKYDAAKELKICNNSNINEILNKIRAEIEKLDGKYVIGDYGIYGEKSPKYVQLWEVLQIINKYKEEK